MTKKTSRATALKCAGLGLLAALSPASAPAAPDPGQMQPSSMGGLELILFEAPGCIYCPVFRRDVAPSYAATRAGKAAPLRVLDINDEAASAIKLSSPVTVVPTVVLVRDGVEIGRIAGYVGRTNMHRILDTLLPPE
jgi:hypothetical protein